MTSEDNYLKYYDDEAYLMTEVARRFHETGQLDPADFYMMLIWKSDRAKNRHRERLKRLSQEHGGDGTFADAVSRISKAIHEGPSDKDRLKILMTDWEFYTPTATAILTLLYPNQFTVYDWRVKEQVKPKRDLAQRSFNNGFWEEYQVFIELVRSAAPSALRDDLRGCDRYLSGKSYREELAIECAK
jgi:hypothetical protein